MLDEPGTGVYYGGDVAAPVFSTVTGAALRMLGVPFDAPTDAIVLPPPGSVAEEEDLMAAGTMNDGLGVDVPALLSRLNARPRRITADSRQVEPGDAFAAFPGAAADGRQFIADAIARGAGSVLWEAAGFPWNSEWTVANQPGHNLQMKLGVIADFIYGSPTQAMWVIGVTGTNGKTSCSHWIAESLDRCGQRSAVVGTLGNGLVGALRAHAAHDARRGAAARAPREVQGRGRAHGRDGSLVARARAGARQRRRVRHRAFTNLTRDHLDYHGTMAAYGAAKAKLFHWRGCTRASSTSTTRSARASPTMPARMAARC